MLEKDMTKSEIEEFLKGRDTFVQMDYLNRYLKLMPPIDMRKFAYLKLAEVFLEREMFVDAARSYGNAYSSSLIIREKIEIGLKQSKAFILAGKFEDSDRSLRRTISEASSKEKKELFLQIIEFYKKEGQKLIEENKREKASKLYEKLIRMKITDEEKLEIKEILLDLYDKLGKRKEYNFLKGIDHF
jgi:tetratricopeptide (TPR) repeat protein